MELIGSKKVSEPMFCEICEKERKHVINTYEELDNNNQPYTIDYKRCKACGKEELI